MARARYDTIGLGYARTRTEDPRIADAIASALAGAASVVDVGAGAGSYEPRDRSVVAVDPSETMMRQRRPDAGPAVCARAERLPFRDRATDAVMAILTVHHWGDLVAGLTECRRVARDRVVVFTWDGEVSNGYADWFGEYFPEVMQAAWDLSIPLSRVLDVTGGTEVVPVPIPRDCRDRFGGALWGRPEEVLDPVVRAGSSAFALTDRAAIEDGVTRLREDLANGRWDERHGSLRTRDALDLGFRLVVARP